MHRILSKETYKLAKRLASELLEEAGFQADATSRAVPLLKIAKRLNVPIIYREADSNLRPEGMLWNTTPAQPSLFGDVEAEIWVQGLRKRFALAHELGHRIVELRLMPDQTIDWTDQDWRDFLDVFAARLLLPDSLLATVGSSDLPIKLSIPWIISTQQRFQVSISCLLKRLNDAESEGVLRVANCAFVAFPGVSAKQKTNYAPRVSVICMPHEWFVPTNRRLSSLGLKYLAKCFWEADPFIESAAEDELEIFQRVNWSRQLLKQLFRYIVYTLPKDQRVMLATFKGPDQLQQ